ncbi:MAG: DEAD/DEAH box helicase [Promicromonosporaceae bacterium]|nr:DEAD/DEAH box helicase [Promicromonosporaceae bacterium]
MVQPLAQFGPATRSWFAGAFAGPTAAQTGAWEAIDQGKHALVVAPTGSGKTLAAFLWAIDRLHHEPVPEDRVRRCRVLYISPLKALAADVQRNLRSPLTGIKQAAARAGLETPEIVVGMRTGDTPQSERRTFATKPPDVLVTTPESLFLMLTSQARAGLSGVETVILDEIHAVAGTKRGAHLALSLERLDALLVAGGGKPAQRVGLSATVRPVAEVAAFLAGHRAPADGGREVAIVQPPATKEWQIDLVVPVPDLADLAVIADDTSTSPADELDLTGAATAPLSRRNPSGPADDAIGRGVPKHSSVWPHVEERVVDLVTTHQSTLVFANSRRGAERLTARLNELWAQRHGHEIADQGATWPAAEPGGSGTASGLPQGTPVRATFSPTERMWLVDTAGVSPEAPVLARTHHGSMSRTERTRTESELKEGKLPAVVATSSLELGIDMGAVDLVVQVGAPPSVASGLQRVGRAGHQVGAVSHGVIFPVHRGDLVPSTVVATRMRAGEIEPLHVPSNPLDVLAQQVVAALAPEDWDADELLATFRRAHPFRGLGVATWNAVLDMLAGRYPSEDFADLKARIVWDRATGQLSARPGALRLAATSGGTIPDRGLYGVFLVGGEDGAEQRGGKRVGELDEEHVHESRVGDTFILGSSTWRIEEITPDRVLVSPAPGLPGRLPFWKGDAPGRPVTLGRAIGAFIRTTEAALAASETKGKAMLQAAGLDPWAADNLVAYLAEQRTATGRVPDDRTVVVERFRDELGDWRVVIHSPFGARIHTPWALVIAGRLRERYGLDAVAMPMDDGIVLRLPGTDWELEEADAQPPLSTEDLLIDPDDIVRLVQGELGNSTMFAARFRESAARALLLPRRRPDRRQPLWQQRQRAAQLLSVASQYPDFPIMLEAARECLQDDFDVAALGAFLADLGAGQIRLIEVNTPNPSPFAQSLLFGYNAHFLYEEDAPLAERRAAALSLDPDLLAELLGEQGAISIAELLDPAAVEQTEAELQALAPSRQARDAETLWDVLRRTGPHSLAALMARTQEASRAEVPTWLDSLERTRRIIRTRFGPPAVDSPLPVAPPVETTTAASEQYAIIEDAGRLRDALGVALPVGVPEVFTELLPDPLGDLIQRHLRTHGPVSAASIAARFGLGIAVVTAALNRLLPGGSVVRGPLRPPSLGGTGDEWCDANVLKLLRRRSLAALRAEVEPVEPEALGLFLPRWQQVGSRAIARGIDGVLRAIEQLAGAAVPASALENLVLPARVPDYAPALLDELTTSGEVIWCGHGRLPGSGGGDGMVSLHLAASAGLTLRDPDPFDEDGPLDTDLHRRVLDLLGNSGGHFLYRLAELAEASQVATLDVLWDLAWAGWVTNDSLGGLRTAVGAGAGGAHRAARATARARPMRPSRFGLLAGTPGGAGGQTGGAAGRATLPTGVGRWSALPPVEPNPTLRAHALTQVLLERHGVLTKAVAPSEGITGTFRHVYRVLRELEERGTVRRGYFIEGLGGSQFALPGAVDQLRTDATDRENVRGKSVALLLAATDPANPYGAALAWPTSRRVNPAETLGLSSAETNHRPGRKAGALVVLVDGDLTFYIERGGKTVLSFGGESDKGLARLGIAARALAEAASVRRAGRMLLQRVDGIPALTAARERTPAAAALLDAGFTVTPGGLRVAGG